MVDADLGGELIPVEIREQRSGLAVRLQRGIGEALEEGVDLLALHADGPGEGVAVEGGAAQRLDRGEQPVGGGALGAEALVLAVEIELRLGVIAAQDRKSVV